MADTRTINEEFAEIGAELIREMPELEDIRMSDVTIVYLESTNAKKSKGKAVLGECEKISEKYKWGIPADFTITIFAPNVAALNDEQIRILIFHELLHVGIDEDGGYFTRPHDVDDFRAVIDRYGTSWADIVQH